MQTAKQAAKQIIDHVSDQATWDDIMYELYVKQKIENGLSAIEEGRIISNEDAKNGSWAMSVNWTEPALEDLEAIQAYIARDSSLIKERNEPRTFSAN